LSHLRALPFDRIKIDRNFVTAMTSSEDSAAIVVAIARLGESLNMPITAEGVEDAETERELIKLGCAKAQGWHYGKPMSPAATRRMLSERNLLAAGKALTIEGGGMTASALDDIQFDIEVAARRRA
jgi:EAL domain-containing protein (putative c-di-GMP-specific phosphodiesterase class I)